MPKATLLSLAHLIFHILYKYMIMARIAHLLFNLSLDLTLNSRLSRLGDINQF